LARRLRSASQTVAISSTTWPTADGGIITNLVSMTEAAANAADGPDARVIAAARVSVVLGPMPVVGVVACCRRFEGEGHGVVGAVGTGKAVVPIGGAAAGEVGDDLELLVLLMLTA
jgi:hypothetical protein